MMTHQTENGPKAMKHSSGKQPKDLLLIDTEKLFGSAKEIQILHRGDTYRLRITAQQKLILTK